METYFLKQLPQNIKHLRLTPNNLKIRLVYFASRHDF